MKRLTLKSRRALHDYAHRAQPIRRDRIDFVGAAKSVGAQAVWAVIGSFGFLVIFSQVAIAAGIVK